MSSIRSSARSRSSRRDARIAAAASSDTGTNQRAASTAAPIARGKQGTRNSAIEAELRGSGASTPGQMYRELGVLPATLAERGHFPDSPVGSHLADHVVPIEVSSELVLQEDDELAQRAPDVADVFFQHLNAVLDVARLAAIAQPDLREQLLECTDHEFLAF